MLILFAPSKTFDLDVEKTDFNLIFKNETNLILKDIKSLRKIAFQKAFKLSDALFSKVFDYYKYYNESFSYKAFLMFKGEAYKYLDYASLNVEERSFIDSNVLVIDALYGLIKPDQGIKPYRLDFHLRSDLKHFWKEKITHYIKDTNQEIVSLSSKEFDSVLDLNQLNMYEVFFIDCRCGVCKKLSVFNKQMRGMLLRYLAVFKVSSVKDFPNELNGYRKQINQKSIEYIKIHE